MVKIVNEDHEVFVSRVKTLKSEKQSVLSELQQERDRNNPKFKVDWLNPVVGRGVKIDHGHRRTYTETYLQVSVLNQGADSVIKEWKETLKLKDGREVEGELIYGGSIHVPVDTLNGRIELPISPSLIEKWSTVPIQRGGRGIGSVIFLFPQQDEKNYRGGTIILKLWDINSGKYEIEAPLAKENQLGELRTMPVMGPNQ